MSEQSGYLQQLVKSCAVLVELLVSALCGYILVQCCRKAPNKVSSKPIGQEDETILLPSQQLQQYVSKAMTEPAAVLHLSQSRCLLSSCMHY